MKPYITTIKTLAEAVKAARPLAVNSSVKTVHQGGAVQVLLPVVSTSDTWSFSLNLNGVTRYFEHKLAFTLRYMKAHDAILVEPTEHAPAELKSCLPEETTRSFDAW